MIEGSAGRTLIVFNLIPTIAYASLSRSPFSEREKHPLSAPPGFLDNYERARAFAFGSV